MYNKEISILKKFFNVLNLYNTLILFDVTSLFRNIPLDFTIYIILQWIYDQRELETKISRIETNNLLPLCTKIVHCSYDNELYAQKDCCNGVTLRTSNCRNFHSRSGKKCYNKVINTYYYVEEICEWHNS